MAKLNITTVLRQTTNTSSQTTITVRDLTKESLSLLLMEFTGRKGYEVAKLGGLMFVRNEQIENKDDYISFFAKSEGNGSIRVSQNGAGTIFALNIQGNNVAQVWDQVKELLPADIKFTVK